MHQKMSLWCAGAVPTPSTPSRRLLWDFLICSRCPLWFFSKGLEKKWLRQSNFKGHELRVKEKTGDKDMDTDADRSGCKQDGFTEESKKERKLKKRKSQSVTTCFCSFEQLRHHCTDVFEHADGRYNKARQEQVENVSTNVIITHFNKKKYDSISPWMMCSYLLDR